MDKDRIAMLYRATRPVIFLLAVWLALATVAAAEDPIRLSDREAKQVAQGQLVLREIETAEKHGRTFEAICQVEGPARAIVQVLTDYEKYPEFMPNVSRLEVVERSGDRAVLDYTLALPLGHEKFYRLGVALSEPGRKSFQLSWELRSRPELRPEQTIKDTRGYWYIREQTADRSLVLYHVYTDPGPIPFGLGWIADFLSEKSIPQVVLQAKARVEEGMKMTESQGERQN